MADATRRILRVFLASPGDLGDEREAARRIVDLINRGLARRLGWHVDLYGWEDSLPGYSRPQELINTEVDLCDLFLAMLWERWGTPTGKFTSGFEEEFERARARRETTGQAPEIWLFFKAMDPKLVGDPGTAAKQVIAFRKRQIREKKVLFEEFETTAEWETRLWQRLTTELANRAFAERETGSVPGSSPDVESEERQETDSFSSQAEPPTLPSAGLSEAAAAATDVATRLTTGEAASLNEELLSAVRLNLLTAALLSEARTSETYGAHELHLAFARRTQIELIPSDPSELTFVLRTVLTLAENVAGWYWLQGLDGLQLTRYASVRARVDSDEAVRVGAIRILRLAGGLPDGADATTFFTSTLSDSATSVRRAGLELLSAVASDVPDAIEILETIVSSNDEIASDAATILAKVRVAENPTEAFTDWIARTETVPEAALSELRRRRKELSNDALTSALLGAQPEIKALAISELASRQGLTPDRARVLLTDPAGAVREAVVVSGFPGLTKADLELALKDFPNEPVFRLERPDRTHRMRLAFYRRLGYEELQAELGWYDNVINASAAYEVLAVDHFDRFAQELRRDLGDQFVGLKSRSLEATAARIGADAADVVASQLAQYDDMLRDGFVTAALRGLLANATRRDAELMRPFLSDTDRNVREAALAVLAKLARPDDVELLTDAAIAELDANLRNAVALGALSAATRDQLEEVRRRFLASTKPDLVRLALETRVTSKERARMIERARGLTYDGDPSTRKEATRFLVEMLPRNALEVVLDGYPRADHYFYNVVAWLDRVLYAPLEIRDGFRQQLLT